MIWFEDIFKVVGKRAGSVCITARPGACGISNTHHGFFRWAQSWVSSSQWEFCTRSWQLLYVVAVDICFSCCRALISWRKACLKLCLADGDLWNCHSWRKRRFSRTSCSTCRFVFFWLHCVFVVWGAETRSAETSTDSRLS